jgi:hypothetical protein
MRWYETSSRILLILSVVNFALAAPVAVRNIHEVLQVRVDMADVAKDGTGASQSQTRKRLDPWAQWSTTNAADRKSAPAPSPRDSEYTEHWLARSPPANPAVSIASNNPPPSPETSIASNSAESSSGSSIAPNGATPESSPATSMASNSAASTPATSTTSNSAASSPGSPSGSHGGSSPEYGTSYSHGDPSWDSGRLTLSSQWLVNNPDSPETPESVARPLTPPPSSPAPSIGSPPSRDGRPSPPPSPGPDVNPPPGSELQRPAEHESESFLEKLLKGRIRRHISGPVAVDAAYHVCRSLSCPLSSNPSHKRYSDL